MSDTGGIAYADRQIGFSLNLISLIRAAKRRLSNPWFFEAREPSGRCHFRQFARYRSSTIHQTMDAIAPAEGCDSQPACHAHRLEAGHNPFRQ